ncbi:lipopolysaccharide biosynthesis protein [Nonlabens ulvanivorans]|nr:O-antigen translocase [Nonlabens ulvanivorans]GAK91224.1 lipopolysaccharide biosynthesis protein [Nonlabens ulvanivorans]
MRSLLSFFTKNVLLKVASFNGIFILIKISIGAIMSRIIADYAGPAGMAIMGNLRNFTQGIQTFAILGFEHGLVTYAATYRKDFTELKNHYKTAWSLSIISSLFLAIVIFIVAPWLDDYLIATDVSFITVFRLFAVSLPFYVVFIFMTSLLQGFEVFKRYIALQVVISLVIFIISAYLIYNFNLTGALYGIVLVPFIQCIIGFIFLKNAIHNQISFFELIGFQWNQQVAKKFFSYSVMALVSAFLLPMVAILVRNEVRTQVGDAEAGWWEGMIRVSSYYLLFATSLISMYVLPKLSKNDSAIHFKTTITHFYKTILPFLLLGLIAVYFSKDLIIQYLFNAEFDGMKPLFKWQLIGDFIKIVTTVLVFQFIARNDIKKYLVAEIVSVLSFYIFSMILLPLYGIEGIVMAHVANYIVYFIVIVILLKKELFNSAS